MILIQKSREELEEYLGLILPNLEDACKHSLGRYEANDILRCIADGTMQIWLGFDKEVLEGFILTQVIDYPKVKAVRFLCLRGVSVEGWHEFMSKIGDWLPFVKQVEDWALSLGCSLSQIECPATWELYLRDFGYKRGHVLLDRSLV